MNLLPALLAQLLHGGLVLLVAPLLAGGARWLRLRLAGRRGAPPWQEWRDLRRLVAKQPNLPEDASALSRILPYASFATALAAVFLPLGLAPEAVEAPWLAWPLGLLAWAAKLLAVGAVFALAGALVAGMRRQRLPELLGAALLLAVLGAVLLFLGARVA
ncbi:hypothetical protein [Roseomonas mucosa]|uniref:hypothetical protein n=1 Tax=Roseomonas mucosa TaxID=207340 RepID=UPI001EF63951|nr:hypothetical protein [Roseomonas mucosa]MCG7352033.1 hypothetical protein [Roseomonas mucosa]